MPGASQLTSTATHGKPLPVTNHLGRCCGCRCQIPISNRRMYNEGAAVAPLLILGGWQDKTPLPVALQELATIENAVKWLPVPSMASAPRANE